MGVVVGIVLVKAQEVLLFWDASFFRARQSRMYSRIFLFISSLCSLDISARRIHCCMFLSSLFREASSKVGGWIYIGNHKDTQKCRINTYRKHTYDVGDIAQRIACISRRRHCEVPARIFSWQQRRAARFPHASGLRQHWRIQFFLIKYTKIVSCNGG